MFCGFARLLAMLPFSLFLSVSFVFSKVAKYPTSETTLKYGLKFISLFTI